MKVLRIIFNVKTENIICLGIENWTFNILKVDGTATVACQKLKIYCKFFIWKTLDLILSVEKCLNRDSINQENK